MIRAALTRGVCRETLVCHTNGREGWSWWHLSLFGGLRSEEQLEFLIIYRATSNIDGNTSSQSIALPSVLMDLRIAGFFF